MADPFSIAAGVISITAVAAKISDEILKLRTLGQLPSRLHAVKNEVTDLEVVLRQVGSLLQENQVFERTDLDHLQDILHRAELKLSELSMLLHRIMNACVGGHVKNLSRTAIWWKEKSNVEGLQDDIHALKGTLSLLLGTSHWQKMNHIQLELRKVSFLTLDSARQETRRHTILRDFNANLEEHQQGLDQRIGRLEQLVLRQRSLEGERPPKSIAETSESESIDGNGPVTIDTVRFHVVHRSAVRCRSWCPCACHLASKAQLPGFSRHVIGKLFIGYSGLPLLSHTCDFPGCIRRQKPSLAMEYWFPWWFLSLSVKLHVQHEPNVGPQVQLMTLRRIPDSSPAITFALQGNVDGLKALFMQGRASPRDVSDSRGFTLLRWALYNWQFEVVDFLISTGAHVDENSSQNVWDKIFRGWMTPENQRRLRCITDKSDYAEEQTFPLVHQILFGISTKQLETELLENPLATYQVDVQGRSALSWAAARAEEQSVKLLLSYGADPNNVDETGRSALHLAAARGSTECVRLLLKKGANPNISDPNNAFRSTPLMIAVANATDISIIETFIDYKANVDGRGPEGMTALHHIARSRGPEYALLLLKHNADIHAASRDGKTPLTTAIMYNNHDVLKLLLDNWYQFASNPCLKEPDLLQVAAEYSDSITLSILAASAHLRIRPRDHDDDEELPKAIRAFEGRQEKNDKLRAAFSDFVEMVQTEPPEEMSDEKLIEAGLWTALSTRVSLESFKSFDKSYRSETGSIEGSEKFEEALESFPKN